MSDSQDSAPIDFDSSHKDAWLLRWVSTRSFTPFVIYRVGLGLLVMILLGTGVLTS